MTDPSLYGEAIRAVQCESSSKDSYVVEAEGEWFLVGTRRRGYTVEHYPSEDAAVREFNKRTKEKSRTIF